MGKRVTIKGADFSANGMESVVWYDVNNTVYSGALGTGSNTNATTFAGAELSASLGKPINYLRCTMQNSVNGRPAVGSTFAVAIISYGDAVSAITPIKTFTITQEDRTNGYVYIQLDAPVVITNPSTTLGVGIVGGTGYTPVGYQSGGVCLRGTSWNQPTITEQALTIAMSYGYKS